MSIALTGTGVCAELRHADFIVRPSERYRPPPGVAVIVDADLRQYWPEIIGGFADATYNQLHLYAGRVWGNNNLSHIALMQDGEVIAAAQVILQRVPLLGRGVAFVKFGPLWRRKNRQPDYAALEAALGAIKQEYAVRRRLMVIVLPAPDPIYGDAVEDILGERGFVVHRAMTDPNRYLVDVRLSEDKQLASLGQKWRYNLKKALKGGLEISVHDDLAGIQRFMPIFKLMQKRKAYDDKQASLALPAMMAELPPEQRPWIVMASHEGRDTAGCIVGNIGETAYYLFGATDERALKLNAGYAIQWKAIEVLRGQKDVRWYDLGGEANDQGLRQFKKGLTGTAGKVVQFGGEFDYCTDPVSQLVVDSAMRLKELRRRFFKPGTVPPARPDASLPARRA